VGGKIYREKPMSGRQELQGKIDEWEARSTGKRHDSVERRLDAAKSV
jgi:hypothetical protein